MPISGRGRSLPETPGGTTSRNVRSKRSPYVTKAWFVLIDPPSPSNPVHIIIHDTKIFSSVMNASGEKSNVMAKTHAGNAAICGRVVPIGHVLRSLIRLI